MYNILAKAGNSLGYKHSEEFLFKMLGTNNPMFGKTGESNPFFGKSHSNESLEKMRKPKSELHKLKISIANKGNIRKGHSQETLIKLSNAKKGNKHPMFGKVALNARKVYIYSLDNKLVKECSSIIEIAKWLNTYSIKINKYISNGKAFDNKYFIRNTIINNYLLLSIIINQLLSGLPFFINDHSFYYFQFLEAYPPSKRPGDYSFFYFN
jgi:group I intron endonuclease